jgi:hypothetical protein
MKRIRHLLAAFGLALAFAIGQHAAALHALGHAADAFTQSESTPAPSKCADHSLFCSLGAALGGEPAVAPLVAAGASIARAATPASASLPRRVHFLSRAPPSLS